MLSKIPEIRESMVYGKEEEGNKELIITARVIPNYDEIKAKYGKDISEENVKNIYTLIFKDLDCLFFSLL